jgi:hypothetical protein
MSKNRKPYFVCDPCGIQLFVRRKYGIEKLEKFFENAARAEVPFKQHALNFHQLQAILKEIAGVQSEIDKLGFCLLDDRKLRTQNALKVRLETLFKDLERFAETKQVRTHLPKSVEM